MRMVSTGVVFFFFFQAEDGIRDHCVTGVQTCALPISRRARPKRAPRASGHGRAERADRYRAAAPLALRAASPGGGAPLRTCSIPGGRAARAPTRPLATAECGDRDRRNGASPAPSKNGFDETTWLRHR